MERTGGMFYSTMRCVCTKNFMIVGKDLLQIVVIGPHWLSLCSYTTYVMKFFVHIDVLVETTYQPFA